MSEVYVGNAHRSKKKKGYWRREKSVEQGGCAGRREEDKRMLGEKRRIEKHSV